MKNEIYAKFVVGGFEMNATRITEMLLIEPSEAWHKGDVFGFLNRTRKANGWRLESSISRTFDIHLHVEDLLDKLEIAPEALKQLSSQYYCEIGCVIYANDSVPKMHFSSTILSRIEALGVHVDTDFYCLMEDEVNSSSGPTDCAGAVNSTKNEMLVEFVISDFEVDPDQITTDLGIKPSRVLRKGEAIGRDRQAAESSSWRLESPIDRASGIHFHLGALLDTLEPAVKKLSISCQCGFECIALAREYVPEMHFEPELLSRLSSLGAYIDIDMRCLIRDDDG